MRVAGTQGGGGGWSCSRCTYDNHPDMTSCEICSAIRMPASPHTPSTPLQRPTLGTNTAYDASFSQEASRRVHAAHARYYGSRGARDGTVGSCDLRSYCGRVSYRGEDKNQDGNLIADKVSEDYCFNWCGDTENVSDFDDSASAYGVHNSDQDSVSTKESRKSDSDKMLVNVPSSECNRLFGSDVQDSASNSARSDVPLINDTMSYITTIHDSDERCSSDSTHKFNKGLLNDMRSTASAGCSRDNLETFSFISGISHGSSSSRRTSGSDSYRECSNHSACFCHPRPRMLGHRRTGSGGTALSVTKLETAIRPSSSLTCFDTTDAASTMQNASEKKKRLSVDYEKLIYSKHSSYGGNDLAQRSSSDVGNILLDVKHDSDQSNSSSGGGSRSFGYDTSLLIGYPSSLSSDATVSSSHLLPTTEK